MKKPRAISVFLYDGETDSLREAGIEVSTIKAVAFRQTQLARAIEEVPELSTPGAYILFGPDAQDKPTAYIGEAQNVAIRLKQHLGNANSPATAESYEHWVHTVALVSKDRSLSKAHALYLESRLAELAKKAPTWAIREGKKPGEDAGALPKHDRIIAEEILDQGLLLMGTLGLDLFKLQEGLTTPVKAQDGAMTSPKTAAQGSMEGIEFQFTGTGYDARMNVTSSGTFKVLEGSRVRPNEARTLSNSAKKMREDLIGSIIVKTGEDGLILTQDFAFDSVSLAAAVVSGTTVNGRTAWTTATGQTFAVVEDGLYEPSSPSDIATSSSEE